MLINLLPTGHIYQYPPPFLTSKVGARKHFLIPEWVTWKTRKERPLGLMSPELLLELLIVKVISRLLPMWPLRSYGRDLDASTNHWLHYLLHSFFFLFGWPRVLQVDCGVVSCKRQREHIHDNLANINLGEEELGHKGHETCLSLHNKEK